MLTMSRTRRTHLTRRWRRPALLLTAALTLMTLWSATPVTPPASAVQPGSTVQVELDGDSLSWEQLVSLLRAESVSVRLAPQASRQMERTRAGALAAIEGGQRVYGWNQALGPLKDRALSPEDQREFQRRVLRSHAAGVGERLPDRVVRLAMILRANSMARGAMGVRPELVQRMLDLVNAGVNPQVPRVGSLGTGDLQQMAAVGLVLIGEAAPVRLDGATVPAAQALQQADLAKQFTLESGEALPLISGGSMLLARYVDAVARTELLVDTFDGALAMFLEATRAETGAFDARTHAERRIPAEDEAAQRTRILTCESGWMTEEGRKRMGAEHPRVQDAVSVRATPHIVGALRQTLAQARTHAEREANASTSNPLIFQEDGGDGYEFVMGGNWDAALLGHSADALNAQVADLGVLSQELSARLLAPQWSYKLPANLAGGEVGLNSGMVQVQSVAVALVPEMQVRAVPAGTLSRPAKFGQEDHNTMAMTSVHNTLENLDRLATILAVQAMMSAQGIDLIQEEMAGLALGIGTQQIHAEIREAIAPLADDRHMSPDLELATELVRDGVLAEVVRAATASDQSPCAA